MNSFTLLSVLVLLQYCYCFNLLDNSYYSIINSNKIVFATNTNKNIVKSLSAALAISLTTVLTQYPGNAYAGSGQPAKLEYFTREDTTSIGPAIYDEAEANAVKEKKALVVKKWDEMITTVSKGISKGNKSLVQSTIANNMNSLKIDMRRISKVYSGGDILIRESSDKAAQFDYNSGQFALKPIPTQAEAIFNEMNDLYFYAVNDKDANVGLQQLDKVNNMFKLWYSEVK